jgi:AraC family transcriptional activator of pobA
MQLMYVGCLLARPLRTLAPMKPNTLDAFYDALAPGPASAGGVLPPLDMGQGVGHFNVFSLADLRGTSPIAFSQFA